MLIKEQLKKICSELSGHGVLCEYDPNRLNPPCAWITPVSIVGYRLDGDMQVNFDLYLIAPETDISPALTRLDRLLRDTLPLVGGIVVDSDLATTVTLPGGAVCPAMKLTIQPPVY